MQYEVTIATVEQQLLVAARQRTTFAAISHEIQALLDGPWAFLRAHPVLRTDGHNVAVYWNMENGGSIEVGVQVVRVFADTDDVVCSATPAGRVARTVHYGPYDQLGAAHDAVMAWCRERGHQTTLPFWEVYGDWEEDPAKLRTDVLYLLT